jgi:HD-GYP domain-containing protein (c-di-GMP phosphodiesterase class II)
MADGTPHSDHSVPNAALLQQLAELDQVGIALSQEKDVGRLFELIVLAAKRITHADGGTLYRRISSPEDALSFEIVRTESLGIAMGGSSGKPVPYAPLPLRDAEGNENTSMVAAFAALRGRTIAISDAYEEAGFDFSGTQAFDRQTGYRSRSFLTVPMKNQEDEVIGVLQLINRRDPATGDDIGFSPMDARLAESLASQAAVALSNRQLIEQLEVLFEALAEIINGAIDEKSPYTAGHCKRVPELTMLLAEAVQADATGPFAEWHMTDRARYELRIAALLHDCGKITTPVHVVDKATKLETVFDRMDLVETRFEVFKRDAEIAILREDALEAGNSPTDQEERLGEALREIEADRDFLRACNAGAEYMPPADQERVRAIARKYRWRDSQGEEVPGLSDDEVANLTIPAGTLTPEERQIINHHVTVTIRMLEALPWPPYLKNVPEFAGGHHERMDGTGYPRGLTGDQMPIEARIMGIADIFEALTASDRPYKDGKTLSESLHILGKMSLHGHIDPELFTIFVRERVYLKYAREFLPERQIDEIEESSIPGYRGH